jgi:hypothetical protein
VRLLCLPAISRRIVIWGAVKSGHCDISLPPPNKRLHPAPRLGAGVSTVVIYSVG